MEGNHLLVSANRIPRSVSLTVDKLYHATCVLLYCVFTDVCQSARSVPFYLCTCALVAGPCICTGVCNIGRSVPVPVYCQWSVLQWPLTLCLYQLDRSAVPGSAWSVRVYQYSWLLGKYALASRIYMLGKHCVIGHYSSLA